MKLYFIPILCSKDGDFIYPHSQLTERAESGIKSLLSGFEILQIQSQNLQTEGVISLQAELDEQGKIVIIREDKDYYFQIENYLYRYFTARSSFSFPYSYRGKKYRMSLIFMGLNY